MSAKILVADHSHVILRVVEVIFREKGFAVSCVETGAECLAQAANGKPDLILLNYEMEDLSGMEICQALLADPSTCEIPVVAMGSDAGAILQLYRDFDNVAAFLDKPFSPEMLYSTVERAFQMEFAVAESVRRLIPVCSLTAN